MARNQPRKNPPLAQRLARDPQPALVWVKGDQYHIHAGRYFIAKCWTASGWRYVASMSKQPLGVFDTADQAKARCLEHAKSK